MTNKPRTNEPNDQKAQGRIRDEHGHTTKIVCIIVPVECYMPIASRIILFFNLEKKIYIYMISALIHFTKYSVVNYIFAWFSQSEVFLLSNTSEYRIIWRTIHRTFLRNIWYIRTLKNLHFVLDLKYSVSF